MTYVISSKLYKSIEKALKDSKQQYGFKAVLIEINRMVNPVMSITRIIIEKGV